MAHTPKTCDDCSLTWDRQHNPKDIVLCPLHATAPALLEALEAQGHILQESGEWHATGCTSSVACSTWCEQARAAIEAAKGER